METVRCDFKCSTMVGRQFVKLMKELEKRGVIHEFDEWGLERLVAIREDNNP